ncbi:hypothetical protein FF38_05095 [Lucilia cuprina]|uniref:Cuticle protein 6 n=1 Tax=Lucilia cuprina TaxID=7375 RepID=A0A0L0C5N5_LUCCU|nr:uncharacterized protein LOC111683427 [Lucilia cuprina]KAI8120230.1 hypothetical protein CVS40_8501 [Lucilia cuprina]KNC27600.1 hypothetical protein FF38_05095 [Lucilia cuprina]
MKISYMKIFWCLIVVLQQQQGYGQELGKSQANSYFYLKQNGGYEYAFNTDTGLQSAQTADQANEVTGHYMYYEKGVPFMVKYRAGRNGYQPEIIPAEKLMNGNFKSYTAPENSLITRDSRTSSHHEANANGYRLSATNTLQTPKVSSFNIGSDSTLNFVQSALKTMQTQPMHMSFTSELGQIQHPPVHTTTSSRPVTSSTVLQPVTRNDVQDINNLALLPSSSISEAKHPYSFNYNADQSARSETSDPAGNVVGSYSYYDEAGYHDISYKANDDTGFVVLGGNLAHNQLSGPSSHHQPQRRQLFRNSNFNFNNYRITSDPRLSSNALDERNLGKRSLRNAVDDRDTGKRSLRKFRRYAKW